MSEKSSSKALIEIRDLSKSYQKGKTTITPLEGLSLDVPEGEFLALMGPSGSGKTTLLNLVAGIDTPTTGSLRISGRDLSQMSRGDLTKWRSEHVGYIFQLYHLIPILTAYENVELPLLLSKLSRRERKQRIETALELVGLSDRSGHRPTELSGGQEQRVAIARAIVHNPELLVADEPTGDLDRESADSILGLLRDLTKEHGKTVVMVTHDPKAASAADRTLHLEKGPTYLSRYRKRGGHRDMKFVVLAIKTLTRNQLRTLLTILGVATGMFLFASVETMQHSLGEATQLSADDTTLVVYRENRFCPSTSRLPEHYGPTIKKLDGVREVIPIQITVNNCGASLDVITFRGIPPGNLKSYNPDLRIVEGNYEDFLKRSDAALVGGHFAARRALKPGDQFEAVGVKVQVAAIIESDSPQDNNVAYVHLPFLQEASRVGLGVVTQFNVKVDSADQIDSVAAAIDETFRADQQPTSNSSRESVFCRNRQPNDRVDSFYSMARDWSGGGCVRPRCECTSPDCSGTGQRNGNPANDRIFQIPDQFAGRDRRVAAGATRRADRSFGRDGVFPLQVIHLWQ